LANEVVHYVVNNLYTFTWCYPQSSENIHNFLKSSFHEFVIHCIYSVLSVCKSQLKLNSPVSNPNSSSSEVSCNVMMDTCTLIEQTKKHFKDICSLLICVIYRLTGVCVCMCMHACVSACVCARVSQN